MPDALMELHLKALSGQLNSLCKQARYEEAVPLARQLCDLTLQELGPDHLDTARSLNNLGYLLKTRGDLAGARPYYEQALAICRQTAGPEHPYTANCLNNLGALLEAMGDLAGARSYLEQALAIYRKALVALATNNATNAAGGVCWE